MNKDKATELLNENLKNIFAFSISRLYDKQDAEDLTNDIVVEVLSSVHRLENDDAFYGFMWKIAENTFKSFVRKKSRESAGSLNEFRGVNWGTPEDYFMETEDMMTLRRELSILSKQYREVTVMHYIQNKSVSEISKELKISEEMVKYYLFKTRKILKEGVNVQRSLGEKSYNPGTFGVDFWGGGDNSFVWQTFERRLPGNIVLAAYRKPLRMEELSLELGVSAPYLEDELEILLGHNFIKQTGNKYQTDFIIFEEAYENEILQKVPSAEICKNTVRYIYETVDELLPEIKELDTGIEFDENQLRWFTVNFALINALNIYDRKTQERFGGYPRLNSKAYGVVFGHDNNYDYGYFNGIYGTANKDKTARYDGVNYKVIEKCQKWHPINRDRVRVVLDAILRKKLVTQDEEFVAQLVSENVVLVNEGMLKANFPVLTYEDENLLLEKLKAVISEIQNCMEKVCNQSSQILKKHTPEHLTDKCEYLCFMRHQADVIGIIAEELVKIGYLKIPDERCNLCIYGVEKDS